LGKEAKERVEGWIEGFKKRSAIGRVGTPQDIANLALFLTSDDSSFITGQVICCDGGHLLGYDIGAN
jgi:NAD(P)-dependent dehydrogenase (short-subunit alcohol dehydrogenase family)